MLVGVLPTVAIGARASHVRGGDGCAVPARPRPSAQGDNHVKLKLANPAAGRAAIADETI